MPKVEVLATFDKEAAKLLRRHPDKRSKFAKSIAQLASDPWHPSLRTKRYDRTNGIWQSYVEAGTPSAWRMWWRWDDTKPDTIVLIEYGPHP